MPPRWIVYATYNASGAHAPHVADQLRAYRALGFETLVVDTSPHRSSERESCWGELATRWTVRPNIGYDFESYRTGLDLLLRERLARLSELSMLFTNDSCFGPYTPLAPIFSRFDGAPEGDRVVFGITESNEIDHHLQSYWLYFRPNVLPLLLAYFKHMPKIADRESAIAFGELGLSSYLQAEGCRIEAWQSTDRLLDHFDRAAGGRLLTSFQLGVRWLMKRPRYTRDGDRACLKRLAGKVPLFNPTLALGSHMHFEGMTPFVKRQLIRDNPNHDRFVPLVALRDDTTNEEIFDALRCTDAYQRTYGREQRLDRSGPSST